MKIQTMMAALIGAAALYAPSAQAQTATQELYTVKFRATCQPAEGRSSKLRDRDLIQQYVGTGFSQKELRRNYALVYNPSADSIQVVNASDGSLVSDVFIFEGGNNVTGNERLERFTFVFGPNQSEAIGSAVITERALNGKNNRARISGDIQFTMPDSGLNGTNTSTTTETAQISTDASNTDTNTNNGNGNNEDVTGNGSESGDGSQTNGDFVQAEAASTTTPGVQICSGNFTAGKLFEPNQGQTGSDGDVDDPGTGETPGTNNVPPPSNDVTNSTRDVRFVTEAAQSGLFEVEMGQLASGNSTNEAVVAYGQRLIQDHTQANAQLADLAASRGITLPTTLSTSQRNILNELEGRTGDQFDRLFAAQAIATHRSAIALHQNAADRSDDSELQNHAETQLPVLQEHLTEAQQLQRDLR